MPEQHENNHKDFSIFDSMSSEMLENILRADAQQLDDNTNIDAILYITELLEDRAQCNNDSSTDVDRMYQQFVQWRDQKSVSTQSIRESEKTITFSEAKKPKKKGKMGLRLAVAIAAAVCLLVVSTGVAAAFGFNIWGIVATWTEDFFFFERTLDVVESDNTDHQSSDATQLYGSLQDALDHFEIGCVTESSALKEAYLLNCVDVVDEENSTIVYADYYAKDDGIDFLSICVRTHNGMPTTSYEKTENSVEAFPVGDVICYAFNNTNNVTVVWLTEKYECRVSGTAPMKEIKQIVISMIER